MHKFGRWRIILLAVGSLLTVGTVITSVSVYKINADTARQATKVSQEQAAFTAVLENYKSLVTKTAEATARGIDTAAIQTDIQLAREQLIAHDYVLAEKTIASAQTKLAMLVTAKDQSEADAKRAAEELAKRQGIVAGTITGADAKALNGVTVTLLNGTTPVVQSTSDAVGHYSLTAEAGSYTLSAAKSGYTTVRKTVELKGQETMTVDITLTVAPATPTPTPRPTTSTVTSSAAGSSYERKSVSTSRGTFSVDLLTMDSGKVRMLTDVAADNDCSDNCPTKSLQSYVSSNGGFAGMNGTYFCPADYAECAGKVNTFYWKVFVSRLNKIINANNGGGESDPAIVMTTGGSPRYFSHWSDFIASGISITAGINSRPALVHGGQIVLDESQLDDKQRTTKGNRGALGIKGESIYAIIARSATVIDLAAVAQSLGLDSAMNLDGGGSSAMYYNGAYKVGPGRSLPNAIIFVSR